MYQVDNMPPYPHLSAKFFGIVVVCFAVWWCGNTSPHSIEGFGMLSSPNKSEMPLHEGYRIENKYSGKCRGSNTLHYMGFFPMRSPVRCVGVSIVPKNN